MACFDEGQDPEQMHAVGVPASAQAQACHGLPEVGVVVAGGFCPVRSLLADGGGRFVPVARQPAQP